MSVKIPNTIGEATMAGSEAAVAYFEEFKKFPKEDGFKRVGDWDSAYLGKSYSEFARRAGFDISDVTNQTRYSVFHESFYKAFWAYPIKSMAAPRVETELCFCRHGGTDHIRLIVGMDTKWWTVYHHARFNEMGKVEITQLPGTYRTHTRALANAIRRGVLWQKNPESDWQNEFKAVAVHLESEYSPDMGWDGNFKVTTTLNLLHHGQILEWEIEQTGDKCWSLWDNVANKRIFIHEEPASNYKAAKTEMVEFAKKFTYYRI